MTWMKLWMTLLMLATLLPWDFTALAAEPVKLLHVRAVAGRLEVVTDRQPPRVEVETMLNLQRGVVDLYGTVPIAGEQQLSISVPGIEGVRVQRKGSAGTPVTRVILALSQDTSIATATDPADKGVLRIITARTSEAVRPMPAVVSPVATQGAESPAATGKVLPMPVASQERVVIGIEILPDALEIVGGGTPADYKAMVLDGPGRLVVDLLGYRSGVAVKELPVDRFGVRSVRFGAYPEKLRLVFDAGERPFPAHRLELTPRGLRVIFVLTPRVK